MTHSTRRQSPLGSRRLASVLLFLVGAFAVSAPSAAQDFPEFTAPVVDEAGVVPDDAERQVNDELLSYQERTGNQIAVAVIDTIGDASVEDYSIDLAKEWGVGSAEEDNGVLLFIAIEERKLRIEVGEGIEGELTDLESGRIRDQISPLLTAGEFGEAILTGTRAIRSAVGDPDVPPVAAPDPEPSRPAFPGWVFSIIPFVIFPMLFGARRRRRSVSPVFWGGGTVRHDSRRDRHRRYEDDDDDDRGSGWLGAAILGSILLGGGRHGGGGWGGGDSGGGGGFDFGGGGGGDFGGGGASGDW